MSARTYRGRRIIDASSPTAARDAQTDWFTHGSVFIRLPGATAPKMSDTITPDTHVSDTER